MPQHFENIAVLLPALNEESSIAVTIAEVRRVLPGAQITVVDNGSSDNTSAVCNDLGVKVLFEPRKGKGRAVKRGFLSISKEIKLVFLLDADDTYQITPVLQALKDLDYFGYDMIVGSRQQSIHQVENRKKPFRRGHSLGNRILTKTYFSLFGIDIQDSLSGWRLMTREFVDTFTSSQKGFGVEAELNTHAFVLQCSVGNINVDYSGRSFGSSSKLSTYKDGIRILLAVLMMFRNERPSIAFNILSFPWIISGIALASRSFSEYFTTGKVLHFPSLIAGMSFCVIGALLWVTGMILERTKLLKYSMMQIYFKGIR